MANRKTSTSPSRAPTRVERAIRKAAAGERVHVRHNGDEAVIVPVEDAALLDAIEDYLDVKDVLARRKRMRARGEKAVDFETVAKRLRL